MPCLVTLTIIKFPKIGIDTTVKRADYAEMLKESEFTLVIPSYEDTDFSSIRFWDAITKACVPFILESCNWRQAFLKHLEITQIIEEDLLVSAETVKDKIENTRYEELLNKIWNSKDWKVFVLIQLPQHGLMYQYEYEMELTNLVLVKLVLW